MFEDLVPFPEIEKIVKPKELLRLMKRVGIRFLYRMIRPQPNLIEEMTWDNLIVLDACRFDAFAQVNNIPGKLTRIISAASCTWDWFPNNFSGRNMRDVVYISANPYGSYYYLHKTLGHIPFYKIVEVWKDSWSKELKTVHPSAVNQATLESLDSHPEKRHIIHYLQPHHPFIGDVKIIDRDAVDLSHALGQVKVEKKKHDVFGLLEEGAVDVGKVWRAYVSNLQLVMSYVKQLLPALSGKICITSDHGNSFGRFGVFYGHPSRTFLPEMIEVPWLEVSR